MSIPQGVTSAPLPIPKSLILFGDGVLNDNGSKQRRKSLDQLVHDGCSGFLHLRSFPKDPHNRTLREISQLLGLYDSLYTAEGKPKFDYSENSLKMSPNEQLPNFSKLYGMKTHFLTTSKDVQNVFSHSGFSALSLLQNLKDGASVAQHIANILYGEPIIESVFLHVDTNGQDVDHILNIFDETVSWFQKNHGDLFIVLVSGFGDKETVEVGTLEKNVNGSLTHLIPIQSYKVKDGILLDNVRDTSPLLAVYHHLGLTRRDEAQYFEIEEIATRNGNGRILADAFIKEIGFKMGKLPKYGA